MKYDFCNIKAYSFEEMLSMKNKKFVILSCISDVNENSEGFNPSEVYYFDEYCKLRMLGGEDASKVFVYESLICCDFYLVSEFKEEPKTQGTNDGLKSVITENKEKIKEQVHHYNSFSEKLGDYWSKQPLKKEPIDTTRKIAKETITDIQHEIFIMGEDVTEGIRSICREEIAKSETAIKAKEKSVEVIHRTINFFEDRKRHSEHMKLIKNFHGLDKKEVDKLVNGSWENGKEEAEKAIKKDKVRCRNAKNKQNHEFDGDEKIWECLDYGVRILVRSEKEPRFFNNFRLVKNQQTINHFFNGIKKRKPKVIIDTPSGCHWYDKGSDKFMKHTYIEPNRFTKFNNITMLISDITEAEYLEGIK